MNKIDKLKATIKKAQAEGDNETIVKIKRALYYAKVKAAEKAEKVEIETDVETESFITTSKSEDAAPPTQQIRTDIPRPNLFYDPGVEKNEKEKDLYTKPPRS